MQNHPGQTWRVGAIVNGQVLTDHDGWVRLRPQPDHGGPWRPGDVLDGFVYTGSSWVELPGAWCADPNGRFQYRWWNGKVWTDEVMSNGRRFRDPMNPVTPPAPIVPAPVVQPQMGFWQAIDKTSETVGKAGTALFQILLVLYCLFWLAVAVYAGVTAFVEDNPRYLSLLAPAASQLFVATLIGREESRTKFRKSAKKAAPYIWVGVGATAGLWASLHFDSPFIMKITLILFSFGLLFAYVISS